MKIAFLIARAAIQSVFSQLILLLYVVSTTLSPESALGMTATLFVCLGTLNILFGVLLLRIPAMLTGVLLPFLTSLVTTLILVLYPSLGFQIDFWILFAVLFFSGITAHVLLLSTGASWSDKPNVRTKY